MAVSMNLRSSTMRPMQAWVDDHRVMTSWTSFKGSLLSVPVALCLSKEGSSSSFSTSATSSLIALLPCNWTRRSSSRGC
jgi:hypothetical protein